MKTKKICLGLIICLMSFQTIFSQITGSGSSPYIPRFTGSTSIGNSIIYSGGSGYNLIGIGKTNPAYTLDVNGDINAAANFFASNNVGVGTVNPASKLHVSGGSLWLTGGNATALQSSAGKGLRCFYDNSNDYAVIYAFDYGASVAKNIVITSTGSLGGNVGIGKTNPAYKLDVDGTINAQQVLINGQSISTSQWTTTGNNIYYTTGNVLIGTTSQSAQGESDYRLDVVGPIHATEAVINLTGTHPDFVFKDGYELPTLYDLEKQIKSLGHLPGIPSDSEVKKKGIAIGEMQNKLLQKIEELTLYMIQLKKENTELKTKLESFEQK